MTDGDHTPVPGHDASDPSEGPDPVSWLPLPPRLSHESDTATEGLTRWAAGLTHARRLARVATRRRWRRMLRTVYWVLPLAPLGLRALKRMRTPVGTEVGDKTALARIIANPFSGALQIPGALDELREAVKWLDEHGLPTEVCLTEGRDQATELAREAVRLGRDMVIAAGGDGTVNAVVQALAGHRTALGVLPTGTVNVWAREMGIPMDTPAACKILVGGVRRIVDVGTAGDRRFLMMAGVGFDAEVARRVEQGHLTKLGLKMVDYLATVSVLGLTQQSARIRIRQEGRGRDMQALMVIIGNTRLYGGVFAFTPNAVADDGWLDVAVVGGGGVVHRLSVISRALLRRPTRDPRVRYLRCRTVLLESDPPLPVQVDGEVAGKLPMLFSIMPRALQVIVPPNAPASLFQYASESE